MVQVTQQADKVVDEVLDVDGLATVADAEPVAEGEEPVAAVVEPVDTGGPWGGVRKVATKLDLSADAVEKLGLKFKEVLDADASGSLSNRRHCPSPPSPPPPTHPPPPPLGSMGPGRGPLTAPAMARQPELC